VTASDCWYSQQWVLGNLYLPLRRCPSHMPASRKASPLKVVDASGTSGQIGRKLGRACKPEARSMLEDSKTRMRAKGKSWESALALTSLFMPYAEEHDPEYLEWVEGYAEGSGLASEDLMVLLCEGEKGYCTDVAASGEQTRDGTVLLAHNEDWRETDLEHVVLIRIKPKKGPRFFAVTNGGLELILGMNSEGICFTGNSVYPTDERVGIPKLFLSRQQLLARSIDESMAAALPAGRASSYNTNLVHRSGEMYCIEGSATAHAAMYAADGYLVHTNHYLDPRMQKFEAVYGTDDKSLKDCTGTFVRYNRARRLLRKSLGDVTADTLKAILKDHVNYPNSICNHPMQGYPPHERYGTNFSVIFDLNESKMSVCKGNPCKGKYIDFVME